jgi:hypothetical protein
MLAPRFAPLGIDHGGRTFFALALRMAKPEAVKALFAGDTSKSGKAHAVPAVRHGFGTDASRRPRPSERGRGRGRVHVGPPAGGQDPQARGLDRDQEWDRGWRAAGRARHGGRANRRGEQKALRRAVELPDAIVRSPTDGNAQIRIDLVRGTSSRHMR